MNASRTPTPRLSLPIGLVACALTGLMLLNTGCPNFFKGKPKPVNPPSGGEASPRDGYFTQSPVVSWSASQISGLTSLTIRTNLPVEKQISETAPEISVRTTIDFEKSDSPNSIDLIGLWSGNVAHRSTLTGRNQILVLASSLTDFACVEKNAAEILHGLCARRVRVVIPKVFAEHVIIEPLDESLLQPDRSDLIL